MLVEPSVCHSSPRKDVPLLTTAGDDLLLARPWQVPVSAAILHARRRRVPLVANEHGVQGLLHEPVPHWRCYVVAVRVLGHLSAPIRITTPDRNRQVRGEPVRPGVGE